MQLEKQLKEACKRSKNVLGGFCGFYGNCGAADMIREKFGIDIGGHEQLVCKYHSNNRECKREKCPFYDAAN